jgi:hypothetical protein
MGCCGGRHNAARSGRRTTAAEPGNQPQVPPARTTAGLDSPPPRARRGGGITQTHVRYEGRTGLTAIGGATGTRYRFDHPGATVQVHPRDLASLARVPGLRQVTAD